MRMHHGPSFVATAGAIFVMVLAATAPPPAWAAENAGSRMAQAATPAEPSQKPAPATEDATAATPTPGSAVKPAAVKTGSTEAMAKPAVSKKKSARAAARHPSRRKVYRVAYRSPVARPAQTCVGWPCGFLLFLGVGF